jgi:hypothetical protein
MLEEGPVLVGTVVAMSMVTAMARRLGVKDSRRRARVGTTLRVHAHVDTSVVEAWLRRTWVDEEEASAQLVGINVARSSGGAPAHRGQGERCHGGMGTTR